MKTIVTTINPSTIRTLGAAWCVKNVTDWMDSGESYTLPVGTHTIQYKAVEGYATPADVTVVSTAAVESVGNIAVYVSTAWGYGWKPPVSICLFHGQVLAVGAKHTAPEASVADARVVRWSEIGAFRFLGATANPLRNEAGEYYLEGSDLEAAMAVKPLKTGVAVFGQYSTTILKPVSQPAPTFAVDRKLGIGIANPLAVGGNEKKLFLVDTTGNAWLLFHDSRDVLTEKSLGYVSIFEEMQDGLSMATGVGIISVVYNEPWDEFYISNGVKSYVFNDLGLTRIDKAITSCVDMSGSLMSGGLNALLSDTMLGATTVVEAGDYAYFKTDIVDFNMSAIKTINTVEVAGAIGSTGFAEVMVEWRNSSSEDFRQTAWKRCSPSGIAAPIVSGKDFRICYRVTPWTDVQVNAVTVEWQLSDKTSVRGNYTNVSSLTAKSDQ